MLKATIPLARNHVADVMTKDVLIGSDTARDGAPKRFCFNPAKAEYRVYHGQKVAMSVTSWAESLVDAALARYNEL